MRKKISAILCIIALAVSFMGCSDKKQTSVDNDKAINVSVYKVEPVDLDNTVTYTGEIKASEETNVSSKASGIARAVTVNNGDFVYAGETILVIDDTDYRLQYNQAQAAYNSALATYNSTTNGSMQQTTNQLLAAIDAAKLEYNNALTNYNRIKTLFDMGAVSRVEFDGAKSRLDSAELSLNSANTNYELMVNVLSEETKASAKAAVDSAKAALDIAQNSLNNTVVTAPISGYITGKSVNVGQMVGAGTPLFTIKSTDVVDAEINVTESIIPYISVGTKANIQVKSAGIDKIKGKVSLVNPVKNQQTGMYSVRVQIMNDTGVLKEGMLADVVIITKEQKNIIAIPSEAIMQEDEDMYVFVAKNDVAEKRIITTGYSDDTMTEVLTGLVSGENVVVLGKEYLSENNNKIKIVEE